jgi:hypothetical protein
MRPKKRVLVMTEFGELRFVLRNQMHLVVISPDALDEDICPAKPFDLAILDGRGGRIDLALAVEQLQAIAGRKVPLLLIASGPIVGVQVNRVLYRNIYGEGLTAGVFDAVHELTRRKRGPAPGIARQPVHAAMLLAAKVA